MTTGVQNLSQEQLLASMIIKALTKNSVIAPTIIDLSKEFAKGKTKVSIPSAGNLTVENTPKDGTELAGSNRAYSKQPLEITAKKTVSDYIYDLDDEESVLDLIADFYADAPQALSEQFETEIVNMMRTAGLASSKKFLLGGTNDDGQKIITLNQLGLLNKAMNDEKVPKEGRKFACSTTQALALRSLDVVRNQAAIGNNNALVNGFVARLEGFDIIESNDLLPEQCMAYHGSTAAYGIAKEIKKDQERQSSFKRTFVSVDSGWGYRAVRDLIWFGYKA